MKFRTKPCEIEARQFTGERDSDLIKWIGEGRSVFVDGYSAEKLLIIATLEGAMTASPGDWIIKGLRGEFYPCKPDVFAMKYEAVG